MNVSGMRPRSRLSTNTDTASLGIPPHGVIYPLGFMVPPGLTVSRFLAGNREAGLTLTTFSSLLLFRLSSSSYTPAI